MREYRKKPYLSTNYKKERVVRKHYGNRIPFVTDFPNVYLDIGVLVRGEAPHVSGKENIDRIKLPCFCSFEWNGKRRLGILINIGEKEDGLDDTWDIYSLIDMSSQTHRFVGNLIGEGTLEFLIKEYKINIGKAHIDFCETYH